MRPGFKPWVGKIPWRRAGQPTPVFLPENPTDRGAWGAAVRGAAESQARLSNYTQCKAGGDFLWTYRKRTFDIHHRDNWCWEESSMTARNTEELCKDIHNLQASPHRLWVNYKGKESLLGGAHIWCRQQN